MEWLKSMLVLFAGAGIGYWGAGRVGRVDAHRGSGDLGLVYSEGEEPNMIYIYRDGELIGDMLETQEDTFIPIVYGPGGSISEMQKSGIVGAPFYTRGQAEEFVQRVLTR